jgi:hypothetical protein
MKAKYIPESAKKIPKNISSLIEDEEKNALDNKKADVSREIDEEEDIPEDLVSMAKRTERAYNMGNGDISENYESPEEVLRKYNPDE